MEINIEEYKSIHEFLGMPFDEENEKFYEDLKKSLEKGKLISKKAEETFNKFSEKSNLRNGIFTAKDAFILAYKIAYRQSIQDAKEVHNSSIEFLNS